MLIIEESERTEKGYWKLCIYDTVFLYIKHCSKKQSALILFKSSWMSISYSSKFRAISMCTVQACECTQTHTHTYTTSILGCHHTWRTTALESHYSQLSSAQPLSRVRLFATPWTAARQASLSITNSRSLLKLTSIESVMPSSHLILCHPLLLLPPIPPSIRVFSMSQLFAWGSQSIGVSASASVLPMNTQG